MFIAVFVTAGLACVPLSIKINHSQWPFRFLNSAYVTNVPPQRPPSSIGYPQLCFSIAEGLATLNAKEIIKPVQTISCHSIRLQLLCLIRPHVAIWDRIGNQHVNKIARHSLRSPTPAMSREQSASHFVSRATTGSGLHRFVSHSSARAWQAALDATLRMPSRWALAIEQYSASRPHGKC